MTQSDRTPELATFTILNPDFHMMDDVLNMNPPMEQSIEQHHADHNDSKRDQ
ncbi:hypothetical protein [Oceanobacillus halotolerans]|uniref:hypothetical protein n=1 Tax=Oceanobacillus halotolerans TaxID=2663380 RepID=UPI0013DAF989|nr:hypothetical protein [Oceanobacillus halotolerans]